MYFSNYVVKEKDFRNEVFIFLKSNFSIFYNNEVDINAT